MVGTSSVPHSWGTGPSAQREPQIPAPEIDYVSMDEWDGNAVSRRRITQGWEDTNIRSAAVLPGDVHRSWANDVKGGLQGPSLPCGRLGTVCTSITSTGNGSDSTVVRSGPKPASEVLQKLSLSPRSPLRTSRSTSRSNLGVLSARRSFEEASMRLRRERIRA